MPKFLKPGEKPIVDLQVELLRIFPGKSAFIQTLKRSELTHAILNRRLPDYDKTQSYLKRKYQEEHSVLTGSGIGIFNIQKPAQIMSIPNLDRPEIVRSFDLAEDPFITEKTQIYEDEEIIADVIKPDFNFIAEVPLKEEPVNPINALLEELTKEVKKISKGEFDKFVKLCREFEDSRMGVLDYEIQKAIDRFIPQTYQIEINNNIHGVEAQHHLFPILLALCEARIHTMLVGPAGSGKSTIASNIAKTLFSNSISEAPDKLFFSEITCDSMMSPSKLIGFVSPINNEYYPSSLYYRYKYGGVYLIDEMDRVNPQSLTTLNTLLSNSHNTFPNLETVTRHEDFICIAGANTYGTGADTKYVSANQLDAASLDRFFNLYFPYDEELEKAMVGLQYEFKPTLCENSGYTIEMWHAKVLQVRKKIEGKNIPHVVSPRATLYGSMLLKCMPKKLLEDGLLWKGLSESYKRQIESVY